MSLENSEQYALSVNLLNGHRFNLEANKNYIMPNEVWEAKKDNPQAVAELVAPFVEHHFTNEAPRITELQRYYVGDNDIHYWRNGKSHLGRSDNRVASGFPKFITNVRTGYMLGNPIKYEFNGNDDKVTELIDQFNNRNDDAYHNKVMKQNLSITGRAYELVYTQPAKQDANGNYQTADLSIKAIDPATAFVVYDTTIEANSLFGVRYYLVDYNNNPVYYIYVYTDNTIFYYQADLTANNGDWQFINQESHPFQDVPLTEYLNNDNRTGDWESKLDEIDAYDQGLSEMANSQEDFANAKLKITGDIDFSDKARPVLDNMGNPVLDKDGNEIKVPIVDTADPYIMLKPSIIPSAAGANTVVTSDASYITKQLNEAGWKIYMDRLAADIHKDTNTPDTSDQNFGGNASGVAMSYKLWGEDQERSMQEALFTRGLMRRLRLLATYWFTNGLISNYQLINDIQPVYTPNLPKNDQEIVDNLTALTNTGLFSEETLRNYASSVTGVDSDTEAERMDKQAQSEDLNQLGNPTPLEPNMAAGVQGMQQPSMQDLFSQIRNHQKDDQQ